MVTIKVLIRQNKISKKKISRQSIYNIKYRFIKCNVIIICKAQEKVCRSPMCLRLAKTMQGNFSCLPGSAPKQSSYLER